MTPDSPYSEREWLEGLRYEDKFPDWPTDRCAECGTTEGLHNPCPDKHPPLCEEHVELWYPRNPPDDDVDCRSLPA